MASISFTSFHIESNHISGYLSVSNFSKNSQDSDYVASVNRFSGPVPTDQLNSYAQVNVLEGNIFSCGQYPDTDPLKQKGTYNCASKGLETVLVGWGSLAVVFTLLMLFFAAVTIAPGNLVSYLKLDKLRKDYLFVVLDWLRCSQSLQSRKLFSRTTDFLQLLTRVTMIVLEVGLLTLTIAVVLYATLKSDNLGSLYKTHTEQYSYFISAVFMSGKVPAASMLVLFLTTIALLLYLLVTRLPVSTAVEDTKSDSAEENSRSVSVLLRIKSVIVSLQPWIIVLVLSIPFLAINLTFVDISNQNRLSPRQLLALQWFISICNTTDVIIVQFILRTSSEFINLSNSSMLICLCTTCVLLDLVVPIISTVFSDSLCFKGLYFDEQEPIVGHYDYEQCTVNNYDVYGQYVDCEKGFARESLYYQPPYLYSYQCR